VSSIVGAEAPHHSRGPDRRRVPRGGRRAADLSGRYPRIAIIERYEGVRRPCARYLAHFNFDVAEAADVPGGLALLHSELGPPAVILIEDAASIGFGRLQEHARALSIPIVSLTSAVGDPSAASAWAPAGVLLKPFTLGAMLDEIRRVLRADLAPVIVAAGEAAI
jgi:DNA-binding response OmpR family regulator